MNELKPLNGGGRTPAPPEPKLESYWNYAWMFAVSAIIWGVIGYRLYRFVIR